MRSHRLDATIYCGTAVSRILAACAAGTRRGCAAAVTSIEVAALQDRRLSSHEPGLCPGPHRGCLVHIRRRLTEDLDKLPKADAIILTS